MVDPTKFASFTSLAIIYAGFFSVPVSNRYNHHLADGRARSSVIVHFLTRVSAGFRFVDFRVF